MQQNLNSWCISKSSGLIVRWARVAPCPVVSVMFHHESNTKHRFFWAWNPRSRHSTAHICLLQMHHISSRTCSYFRPCRGQICRFQLFEKFGANGVISLESWYVKKNPKLLEWEARACSNIISWKQWAGQQEGICKVYGRKTNWKTNWKRCPCSLASKQWGALEAPWQMTPIIILFVAFTCSEACDIIAEDAFSVTSQHSSISFIRSAGTAWQALKWQYSWISQLRLEDLKTVTFYFVEMLHVCLHAVS